MKTYLRITIAMLAVLAVLSACQGTGTPEGAPGEPAAKLQVESSAFAAGQEIPARYTCDGDDISPPLSWSPPPSGTGSLALIVDDPVTPTRTYVHWVLFNMPAGARSLPEAVPHGDMVQGLGAQGANFRGQLGYAGPCPPEGDPAHRYAFRLYALDTVLDLEPGIDRQALDRAMAGHILAEGVLEGSYGR
jgi:Raf kinase inhibitor-like YbhB/YbcL family protein